MTIRIKGESFSEAYLRLTEEELGQPLPIASARLLGAYEHFYQGNFADEAARRVDDWVHRFTKLYFEKDTAIK